MSSRLVLLLLVPLAACRTEPPVESSPEASAVVDGGELQAEEPPPPAPRDVILSVDADDVSLALVEGEEQSFDLNIAERMLEMGDTTALDSVTVRRWLERFSPLAADGVYDSVEPASVQNNYGASVTFVDGADVSRTLFFQRQEDGIAVVVEPEGPVWRVSPEAFASLVPPASDFRSN